jgi:hypothetical protein
MIGKAEFFTREKDPNLDEYGESRKYLERLKDDLLDESQDLLRRKFPVDSECRIDPRATGIFTEEDTRRHTNQVSALEGGWENDSETEDSDVVGELLEVVLTLGINKRWFGGRLIAVRTSRFDDYVNGIDTLIIDTETGQPIAVIDEATKGGMKAKDKRVIRNKIEQGASISYGIDIDENNEVHPRSYKDLPVFYISLSVEDLLSLAKDLSENSELSEFKIVQGITEDLERQAENAIEEDPEEALDSSKKYDNQRSFPRISGVRNPLLRKKYGDALEIFRKL